MRELPFGERTVPALLEAQARASPERVLVREHATGRARTYAETRDRAAGLAGALREAGAAPGERVAILSSNRMELLDTWLACGWVGAISVPINTALKGDQLEHVLGNTDPGILVVEHELLERCHGMLTALPSLEEVWVIGETPTRRLGRTAVRSFPEEGDPIPPHPVHPGDTLCILYTSGTTGPAKGVMCPHAQLYWYGANTARHLDLTDADVLYTVLPMCHINALNTLVQALLCGATYAFGKRFSATSFWREIEEAGATATYLLGSMIHILLEREPSPTERDHDLRIALCPATLPELVDVVKARFGFLCVEGYGSTETTLTHSNRLGGFVPGVMGSPLPGVEARAVDRNDEEVPAGVPGELVLRPGEPFSFSTGYWRLPEQTLEAWRNLWFHTGDRVVVDEGGTFRFLDRMKDSIRRRGENVSAYDVELALQTHPGIELAAAVPVPSELGEDEVMAFIVPSAGTGHDPVAIIRHLEPRLAYFAIPRFLEFVDELPLTENGKVRKHELRERGVGPATWDREAAGIRIRR